MTAIARLRPPRGAVIAALVGAGLLVVALAGGRPGRDGPPLDPRSDGPLGTSALMAVLEGLGAQVDLSVGLPTAADDVALLLQDRLDQAQTDQLVAWVRDGGTLVVTDPASSLTPLAVPPAGLDAALDDGTVEPGRCTIAALEGIGPIEGGAPVRYEVREPGQRCFSDDAGGAFVVARDEGAGTLVAVGGAAFVTNDLLDERDNAVLAAALLAPERGMRARVVDAPIPAGGGDKTLGDLVAPGVTRGLLQLAVAFVLYALWRSMRLGQPVPEGQPVDVAGSELVAAIGRLLGRTRSPQAAADRLRVELRRALRARLGVPPTADLPTLAAVVAARTGTDVDRVLSAIGDRPVTTDAELVDVARAVSSIHQEVLR